MSSSTSSKRSQLRLDSLLQRARDHQVSEDNAAACVAGVQEWAALHKRSQERERSQRWLWALGGGLAAAALVLLVLSPWTLQSRRALVATVSTEAPVLVESPAPAIAAAPLQVGERVALVAREGSRYIVLAASAERTEIAIEEGALTARLFPNTARDHELILRVQNLEVRATGTIFSVGLDSKGAAYSLVHEGSVSVHSGTHTIALQAGQVYPKNAVPDGTLGTSAMMLTGVEVTSVAQPDVTPVPVDPAQTDTLDANAKLLASPSPTSSSPIELWRQARALRSTGRFKQAINRLTELALSGDPTWAPLAQLELARLYDSDLSQPAKALTYAKAFLKSHANHELAPEARKLACQALAQLGRRDEVLCP